MFDIGFWEFSLIAIVALVVVGPERLPELARTVGKLIGRARRTMRELKYELERDAEFEEVKRLREEFSKKHLDDITKTLDEPIDIDGEKPGEQPGEALEEDLGEDLGDQPGIGSDDNQAEKETTASR